MAIESRNSTTYVFIPFCYEDQASFKNLVRVFGNDPNWTLVHDEITYMLKYVADKIDSRDFEGCRCFHYMLKDQARPPLGIPSPDLWCTMREHTYGGKPEQYRFLLQRIQVYCFSTAVGVLAFQVQFEKQDPLWLASAQYYLKKVSREKIYFADAESDSCEEKETTLFELAMRFLCNLNIDLHFRLFFYSNPSTERANILTYLEMEKKDDYRYELYYLRRCYGEGFLYTEDKELDAQEIHRPSQDIIWGISPEAAVCLVCPGMGREQFLRSTFYKNFNAQYLFMYVLLLHQKYVLYMFLTKIGIGEKNNLEALEQYRQQLYEFETNFVFSCVTEVPQYQSLYERMSRAFALEQMFKDVREPIVSLAEIRQNDLENQRRKRDGNVNKALFILSLLSFFSALVDSFDFANAFFAWFLGADGVKTVQVICIVLIVAAVAYVFKNLLGPHEKKWMKKETRGTGK